MKAKWSAALFLLLAGCAAPIDRHAQSFVAPRELTAIALVREGNNLFGQSRYTDAELKYRQGLYLYPQARNVRTNLAYSLIKQGQFQEGIAIYSDLLSSAPDSFELLLALAEAYYTEPDFEKAADYYKRALAVAEEQNQILNLARIHRSLAVLNFRRGNEEEALCYSYLAYADTPNAQEAGRHLKMLLALGQNKAAESFSAQLIAPQAPQSSDPKVLFYSGVARFALGQNPEAAKLAVSALDNGARDAGIEIIARLLYQLALPSAANSSQAAAEGGQDLGLAQSMLNSAANLGESPLALYLPGTFLMALTGYASVHLPDDPA
ncbi:MAG: tetratricopeptide repeat protein [Oligoflexia bacterium]|nr:tetratricopeptide repeat protein [Oligoflexia bacterium]